MWARHNQVDPTVALKPGPDPEHLQPTDNPNYVHMTPLWAASAPTAVLPLEFTDLPNPELATGIGPVDQTPMDHAYGVGVGPGLTTLQSQDRMGVWHSTDTGAVAVHEYVHPIMRDGQPHVAIIPDEVGAGDSPSTLQLERTGVGQPNDPEARRAARIKRWYDRYIDMHRFEPAMGPVTPKYARPNQPQPGDGITGTQYDSPFDTSVTYLGSKANDRFVAPLVRRAPGPWDMGLADDGTAQTIIGAASDYGLPQWGL
jgi:hypothetical protein